MKIATSLPHEKGTTEKSYVGLHVTVGSGKNKVGDITKATIIGDQVVLEINVMSNHYGRLLMGALGQSCSVLP